MAYTLEEFCNDCRGALKDNPGAAGRQEVKALMQGLLTNPEFVEAHFGPEVPDGRHTLFTDPELKFVVLAHVDRKARSSPPHDHGRSWAVYGQVSGWSEMGIWQRTDGGSGAGKAELKEVDRYRIGAGEAGVFDVGAIHSVERSDQCLYLRVTGEDLEVVPRLKFDPGKKTATVIESAGITG